MNDQAILNMLIMLIMKKPINDFFFIFIGIILRLSFCHQPSILEDG